MFFKIVIFTLCIASSFSSEWPSEIQRCVLGDLDCLVKTADDFVRRYKNGNEKLGWPVIDPYIVQNFTFNQDAGRPISLSFHLGTAEISGFSTLKFEKAVGWGLDVSKSKYELYATLPKLELKGKYEANGRILFAPIEGNGDFHIILDNCKAALKFKGKTIKKDGKDFLIIKKIKVLMEPSKMTVNLTNLFNNNKDLGDALNELLNANWTDAWGELSPFLLDTTGEIIKEILQNFLDKYSWEDAFLLE